jgi:hypothetical protein
MKRSFMPSPTLGYAVGLHFANSQSECTHRARFMRLATW